MEKIVSLTALIISLIALVYTVKAFLLKSGYYLRGNYTISSSIDCNDKFVSNIIIENLKDRATVIFSVYLKLGRNNYLLIEDFSKSPLILRPFEVYNKSYDPIVLYNINFSRVNIDKLLNNRMLNIRIVLSTTDGYYTINCNTKIWSPVHMYFKNHFTAIIHPIRVIHNGRAFGDNVKYLITIDFEDGSNTTIPLRNGDEDMQIFTNFKLTSKCLETRKNLELFLTEQKTAKKLKCKNFEVVDFQNSVKRIEAEYSTVIEWNVALSFFKYYFAGIFYTYKENRELRKRNIRLQKFSQMKNQNKKVTNKN